MYLTEDAAEATRLLDAVIAECDDEDIPELATLATTLRRWRTEIFAHHATGASNGPTAKVAMSLIETLLVPGSAVFPPGC